MSAEELFIKDILHLTHYFPETLYAIDKDIIIGCSEVRTDPKMF